MLAALTLGLFSACLFLVLLRYLGGDLRFLRFLSAPGIYFVGYSLRPYDLPWLLCVLGTNGAFYGALLLPIFWLGEVIRRKRDLSTDRRHLPKWLNVLGWVAILGSAAPALRLVYEQTFLTWTRGTQMVGFSLVHTSPGTFVLLFVLALLAHVFLLIVVAMIAIRLFRHKRIPLTNWLQASILCLFIALIYVPYNAWVRAIVTIAGPGQHGADYLTFAVSTGDNHLVAKLLDKGVAVDSWYDGATALNAACVQKKIDTARYLLSRGAELNRAPACIWISELSGKKPIRIPSTSIEVH